MERSFFSAVQSWFSAENQGRYLALILAEIAKYHPKALAALLQAGLDMPSQDLDRCRV